MGRLLSSNWSLWWKHRSTHLCRRVSHSKSRRHMPWMYHLLMEWHLLGHFNLLLIKIIYLWVICLVWTLIIILIIETVLVILDFRINHTICVKYFLRFSLEALKIFRFMVRCNVPKTKWMILPTIDKAWIRCLICSHKLA